MNWFRMYHDLLENRKVQELPPVLFKQWINVLALASREEERGVVPVLADVAFALRLSSPKAERVLADLESAGLLDRLPNGQLRPHNWTKRQAASDDVGARVERYRRSKEQTSETLQETLPERSGNALDKRREEEKREERETEGGVPGADAPPASAGTERIPGEVYALVDAYAVGKGLAKGDVVGRSRKESYNALAHAPPWVGPEEVLGCTSYLMTDPFWSQPGKLKADKVVEALPEWRKLGGPAAVATGRQRPGEGAGATLDPEQYKGGRHLDRRGMG